MRRHGGVEETLRSAPLVSGVVRTPGWPWLRSRLAVLLVPATLACGRTALEPDDTRVKVKVEVRLTSIGVYNTLQLEWSGVWVSGGKEGPEIAGDSLALPPASQAPVISFEEGALRGGVWTLAARMVGSGTEILLNAVCQVELSSATTVVRFTEGVDGCAPLTGGFPPME
jgi:hypothetical protein